MDFFSASQRSGERFADPNGRPPKRIPNCGSPPCTGIPAARSPKTDPAGPEIRPAPRNCGVQTSRSSISSAVFARYGSKGRRNISCNIRLSRKLSFYYRAAVPYRTCAGKAWRVICSGTLKTKRKCSGVGWNSFRQKVGSGTALKASDGGWRPGRQNEHYLSHMATRQARCHRATYTIPPNANPPVLPGCKPSR